jgi:hypothetical protein
MKSLALMLVSVAAWGQYYGGYAPERKSDKSVEVALPAFAGTAQTVTARLLTLELSDGNTMNFKCSKKTVWLDGEKRVKPEAIKEGDMIVVEGKKAPDGTMDAVYVRLQRPKG